MSGIDPGQIRRQIADRVDDAAPDMARAIAIGEIDHQAQRAPDRQDQDRFQRQVEIEEGAAGQGDRAIAELDAVWSANLAVVEVEAGSDAEARLIIRRGSTRAQGGALELHYADSNILADELASFGPEVVVISPASLRDAVIERLQRAAADHV